jgi:hypothetical protein
MGRFIKNPQVYTQSADAIIIPIGTTAEQPAGTAGMIRYNTTLNMLEFYNGSDFVQLQGGTGGKSTIVVDSITLDGNTPTYAYTMTQTPTAEENILVFIGGVHQGSTTYTTSGTTITLGLVLGGDHGKTLTVIHGIDTV